MLTDAFLIILKGFLLDEWISSLNLPAIRIRGPELHHIILCHIQNSFSDTCKGLTETCDVEESSFRDDEQLAQKDHKGHGGEDHREDHEGLDRLQPV